MPADAPGSVAGVVLAAGASTRMGQNKLLFRLGGETLIRRTVASALSAGLDPVIVVLGHDAERAVTELAGLSIVPVFNPEYARGINRSLKMGIASVPEDASAAVVMLADMPMVTDRMVAALVERFRASRAPIVVSDYEGVQAPPTLYSRTVFSELGALEGEGCGKQVVRRHAPEVVKVSWPAGALTDVDRPEDYEGAKQRLGAGSADAS